MCPCEDDQFYVKSDGWKAASASVFRFIASASRSEPGRLMQSTILLVNLALTLFFYQSCSLPTNVNAELVCPLHVLTSNTNFLSIIQVRGPRIRSWYVSLLCKLVISTIHLHMQDCCCVGWGFAEQKTLRILGILLTAALIDSYPLPSLKKFAMVEDNENIEWSAWGPV